MSSQNPPQASQQTSAETTTNANQQIGEYFRRMADVRTQPRLRGLRGVCRFDVTEAGTWDLAVNDGEVTVIEGAGNALPADCVVSASAEDTVRIMRREHYMNILTAAMQGLVDVTGDKVFAMALLGNFTEAPVPTGQQR